MSEPSVFDLEFAKYSDKGFNVHPIKSGTKIPGRWNPATCQVELMTGWASPNREIVKPPQPSCHIGILLGPQPCGINLVALDWDDDEIANAAMGKFPAAITKWGKRGFTAFYRCAEPIASRKFSINGHGVADLLCVGKQTVLPPSIHPETGHPYVWDKYSLVDDFGPNELPEIAL
jgi:hypothetical protein